MEVPSRAGLGKSALSSVVYHQDLGVARWVGGAGKKNRKAYSSVEIE